MPGFHVPTPALPGSGRGSSVAVALLSAGPCPSSPYVSTQYSASARPGQRYVRGIRLPPSQPVARGHDLDVLGSIAILHAQHHHTPVHVDPELLAHPSKVPRVLAMIGLGRLDLDGPRSHRVGQVDQVDLDLAIVSVKAKVGHLPLVEISFRGLGDDEVLEHGT